MMQVLESRCHFLKTRAWIIETGLSYYFMCLFLFWDWQWATRLPRFPYRTGERSITTMEVQALADWPNKTPSLIDLVFFLSLSPLTILTCPLLGEKKAGGEWIWVVIVSCRAHWYTDGYDDRVQLYNFPSSFLSFLPFLSSSVAMDPNVSQQAYTSMMKFTIDGRPYLKVHWRKRYLQIPRSECLVALLSHMHLYE